MRLMLKSHVHTWITGAALLVWLSAGGCGSSSQQQETRWADGTLKERWLEVALDDGGKVRHGTYESWYVSGRIHERGEYVTGEKQGTWTEWYDHASTTRMSQGEYTASQPHGTWTYWHNPEHASLHGDHHGDHSEADQETMDMPLLKVANYRHGVAHGEWKSWHASGQVADSMHYVDGKLEGEARIYNEEGGLISVRSYKVGVSSDADPI